MNFIIDKIMPVVVTLMLISVPFLVYQQITRTNNCEAAGGVLVKSSGGWTCVELKRIKE